MAAILPAAAADIVNAMDLTSPARDLGRRGAFTDRFDIDLVSAADKRAAACLHVLQHQPSDRPIEDRFSVTIRANEPPSTELGFKRIILGVYDGHRGPWAAEHVAQVLPERVLGLMAAQEAAGSPGSPDDATVLAARLKARSTSVEALFEEVDTDLMSKFQGAHPILKMTKRGSILDTLASKFGRTRKEPHSQTTQEVDPDKTQTALNALSGCTASMLVMDIACTPSGFSSVFTINLGDSRTVIADISSTPTILHSTVDINSHTVSEQSMMRAQHPQDDPADIFVGGRLFGETLSTRAFGDAMYKLPLRSHSPDHLSYAPLSNHERDLHRHLISQMSAYEQAAKAETGKIRTIPLTDRYDALFSSYRSPPYVSAKPNVSSIALNGREPARDICVILATDGLWDLVSSEEAVQIVSGSLSADEAGPAGSVNLAETLLNKVIENTGKQPGDDVTVMILVI